MRCIMVMFDSLNRHMLPPYNPQTWVQAPNFQRLAERACTFDTSYVCSMPCMPARRDFHTGRPNFLHNRWGPLEPFDDSVPAMLGEAGVYTHLCSDHYHYWEDGGATYHTRYDSWEFYRGQEGDPFVGQVADPKIPEHINKKGRRPDWVNREHIRRDAEFPQTQTFDAGLKFIERNADQDQWFLQIECFDPHEPFCTDPAWKDRYAEWAQANDVDDSVLFDWPGYQPVEETPEQVAQAKRNYAALLTKCDASLGAVMDMMEEREMWDDTMLVVWTDHGFLLGEHDCWAKNWMPLYEQVSHTPLFMWDPRPRKQGRHTGERRQALVQPSIDLGPTLLGLFDVPPTDRMIGHDLAPVLEDDTPVRDAAIFGYHGDALNITDGRWVLMRGGATETGGPLNAYTLMPVKMRGFDKKGLAEVELAQPFDFTRGMPTLRLPVRGPGDPQDPDQTSHLWDLQTDPDQQHDRIGDVDDDAATAKQRLLDHGTKLMQACDAPTEQYERLGLTP